MYTAIFARNTEFGTELVGPGSVQTSVNTSSWLRRRLAVAGAPLDPGLVYSLRRPDLPAVLDKGEPLLGRREAASASQNR